MAEQSLFEIIQYIVDAAQALRNMHTDQVNAPVAYVCVFSQSDEEYGRFLALAKLTGDILENTPTWPIFEISPLKTSAGILRILKIRIPDPTRPERWDADFTISNYQDFKHKHLHKKGFSLIVRENFEMTELMQEGANVRAYFSNPPADSILKKPTTTH